jgi:hypothetical protein
MTLIEDFESRQDVGDYPDHEEIANEIGATFLDHSILNSTRWGHVVEYVYMRSLEYARVTYEVASGDGSMEYYPTWTAVRPVPKTIITYTDLD